jgi:G:T/U-mismatch repair DNA glycosylase
MNKGIYKLSLDCGRMGTLQGVFIATDRQVKELVSSKIEVYFGEILGKHSEVWSAIEKKHIKLLTTDSKAVEVVEKYDLSNGVNPFNYRSINFKIKGINIEDMHVGEVINLLIDKNKK